MPILETSRCLQIVSGNHPAYEAQEVIDALIDERIRQHKIQMLRQWERNHQFDSTAHDEKIALLAAQRQEVKSVVALAKKLGLNVDIQAKIEVRVIEPPVSTSPN